MTTITTQIPGLRITAKQLLNEPLNDETIIKTTKLVDELTILDSRLTAWANETVKSWPYESFPELEYSSEIHSKHIENSREYWHSHSDLWVSSMWNSYRSCRLFAHGILLECIETWRTSENDKWLLNRSHSIRVIQEMVNEICASVPFHLDPQKLQALNNIPDQSLPNVPCGDGFNQSSKALGGYLIMWPLFLAASMDYIPDQQRKWIRDQLMYVGNELGIKQATVLSSVSISKIYRIILVFG